MKRLGMFVVLVVGLIAACVAVRRATDATPTSRPAVASPPESALAPASAAPMASAAPLTAAQRDSERVAAGDARLQQKLGLDVTRPSAAREQMDEYDSTELDLFAQVQRASGRDPSRSVRDVLLRRRAGASAAELQALVDREFTDDIVVRATVLRWLDRHGPSDPAGAREDRPPREQKRPVVAPLSPR